MTFRDDSTADLIERDIRANPFVLIEDVDQADRHDDEAIAQSRIDFLHAVPARGPAHLQHKEQIAA